jgi:predicted Fe-Mo cluster-binding NifX family protein
MMKAAFACWDDRIAPVFDTAREFYIVDTRAGNIIRETRERMEDDQPLRKVLRLVELQLDVLVCGAISRNVQGLMEAYGIHVVPFVSGELRIIIDAWIGGRLEQSAFDMPGCGLQRRRHRGWGSGGGRRKGRHRNSNF